MTAKKLTAAQLRRVQKAMSAVPYARLLGILVAEVAPGRATLTLQIRKELTQNHGVVHGGAIASLIDSATAFAILSLLSPKEKVTTVDLTISYLRAVTEGQLSATAEIVRAGRRLFVVSANVTDATGRLIATALSTYIKISPAA
jgi:acyl-CoA thioesterase